MATVRITCSSESRNQTHTVPSPPNYKCRTRRSHCHISHSHIERRGRKMENGESSKEPITYRRVRKRSRKVAAILEDGSSKCNPSGVEGDREKRLAGGAKTQVSNADEIVEGRRRAHDVVLCLAAPQKGKSVQETEDLSCVQTSNLSPCHRRLESKRKVIRRVIQKNVTEVLNAELCDNQIKEQSLRQLNLKLRHRVPKKKKTKKTEAISSDTEFSPVPSLNAFRRRGQSNRRTNCTDSDTQQKGKLDTNVFQAYLENLWKNFSEEKKNSSTYLDCLWFSLYMKESSKADVLKWIKRKKIFSKQYIFVPIVQWCHWSLLIFCHFGESLESNARTPCMLLLDSLQMTGPRRLEPEIRKFVFDIYRSEDRSEMKQLIYKIPLLVPKVPQQRNGEECGNYVLYYINLFLENAPENFSVSDGYPYFMKEDWFTPEGLECFCKGFHSL